MSKDGLYLGIFIIALFSPHIFLFMYGFNGIYTLNIKFKFPLGQECYTVQAREDCFA